MFCLVNLKTDTNFDGINGVFMLPLVSLPFELQWLKNEFTSQLSWSFVPATLVGSSDCCLFLCCCCCLVCEWRRQHNDFRMVSSNPAASQTGWNAFINFQFAFANARKLIIRLRHIIADLRSNGCYEKGHKKKRAPFLPFVILNGCLAYKIIETINVRILG